MSYAIRNTLILAALLLFVFLFFFLSNYNSSKQMNNIKIKLDENNQQLQMLKTANPDMKDQEIFSQSLTDLELRVKNESKLLAQVNNPTITYSYLLDICENYCPGLKFDFKFTGSGMIETSSYNDYSILGVGPVDAFYSFIYQVENQFMLYVVESVRLSGLEDDSEYPDDYIYFTMVIRAYYEDNMLEVDDIPFRYLKYRTLDNNPFALGIHGPVPDEYELKFIDIYYCNLIGLTLDKAFLLDGNGKIHVLNPGDKIAYGYLDHINWDMQNAVFIMNEIGVVETKIMTLKYYEE